MDDEFDYEKYVNNLIFNFNLEEKDEKCYDQQLLLLKKEEELKNFQRVWKFKNLTKNNQNKNVKIFIFFI